jgi:hypothetical protein
MRKVLEDFSRAQLAQLAREYMVASQFNSRTGYAALRMNHGDAAYKDIAIDNWLAASPIYTQRIQRAMGFAGGTDVATIFKGLQLDCGLTHQYFDAHFEVQAEDKGRFWLASCGPLLETEPRGEAAVKIMCHDIEDPTFDGTAIATNPRARMRPVHRPPRVPVDRAPHCEWNVFIDHDAEPLTEPTVTAELRKSLLANLNIQRTANREQGGLDFYNGEVFEQLRFEQLSHAALVVVCKEIAIQNHLLILGLMLAIANKYGEAAARTVAEFQMTGSGWVMSERLKKWLGVEASNIDNLIRVLEVHPAFQPMEYHHFSVTKTGAHTAELHITDCAALHESICTKCGLVQFIAARKNSRIGRHRERNRPSCHTHSWQHASALDNHSGGNRTHRCRAAARTNC